MSAPFDYIDPSVMRNFLTTRTFLVAVALSSATKSTEGAKNLDERRTIHDLFVKIGHIPFSSTNFRGVASHRQMRRGTVLSWLLTNEDGKLLLLAYSRSNQTAFHWMTSYSTHRAMFLNLQSFLIIRSDEIRPQLKRSVRNLKSNARQRSKPKFIWIVTTERYTNQIQEWIALNLLYYESVIASTTWIVY